MNSRFWKNLSTPAKALIVATLMAAPVLLFSYAIDPDRIGPRASHAHSKIHDFDGRKLYREAFELIRDRHFMLADADKRAAFISQWEHRYDHGNELDDPKSADAAISQMVLGVGIAFDDYELPKQASEVRQREEALFGGIGVRVIIKGRAEAVAEVQRRRPRGLADDDPAIKAWMAEAQSVYNLYSEITDERPLIIGADPEEGTPAKDAGLVKGDEILKIKVDGQWQSLSGSMAEEAVESLQGPIDTSVEIWIRHHDTAGDGAQNQSERAVSLKRVELTRSVVFFRELESCVSYIGLTDFVSQFARAELKAALDKAVAHAQACKGAGGLILGLRSNRGGQLQNALALESMLMERGVMHVIRSRVAGSDSFVDQTMLLAPDQAVSVNGADGGAGSFSTAREAYVEKETLTPGEFYQKALLPAQFKVIVLIDRYSASASELVSGALQSNGRALVLGDSSFGKNLGQATIPLAWGGHDAMGRPLRQLRITTFEFRPGGISMPSGIVPDIACERYPADPNEDPFFDSQVKAAIAMLKEQMAVQSDFDLRKAEAERSHRDLNQKLMEQKRSQL